MNLGKIDGCNYLNRSNIDLTCSHEKLNLLKNSGKKDIERFSISATKVGFDDKILSCFDRKSTAFIFCNSAISRSYMKIDVNDCMAKLNASRDELESIFNDNCIADREDFANFTVQKLNRIFRKDLEKHIPTCVDLMNNHSEFETYFLSIPEHERVITAKSLIAYCNSENNQTSSKHLYSTLHYLKYGPVGKIFQEIFDKAQSVDSFPQEPILSKKLIIIRVNLDTEMQNVSRKLIENSGSAIISQLLPLEIFISIFSYMESKDFQSIVKVCHLWKKIAVVKTIPALFDKAEGAFDFFTRNALIDESHYEVFSKTYLLLLQSHTFGKYNSSLPLALVKILDLIEISDPNHYSDLMVLAEVEKEFCNIGYILELAYYHHLITKNKRSMDTLRENILCSPNLIPEYTYFQFGAFFKQINSVLDIDSTSPFSITTCHLTLEFIKSVKFIYRPDNVYIVDDLLSHHDLTIIVKKALSKSHIENDKHLKTVFWLNSNINIEKINILKKIISKLVSLRFINKAERVLRNFNELISEWKKSGIYDHEQEKEMQIITARRMCTDEIKKAGNL